MSLPQYVSYAPTSEPLPRNRVRWQLQTDRAALLVHDMQRYFARVYEPDAPAWRNAVTNTALILAAARIAGIPVAYTAQRGDQEADSRGLLTDMWGPGITAGPDNEDIVDSLTPERGERVFAKHRYSAFARSDFDRWLTELQRDQLIIVGIYAHIGVLATATDAFMRDVQPFVVADAVADFSAEDHDRALSMVARTCGVVIDAELVLNSLDPTRNGAVSDD